jgi:hypothetical protein
MTGQVLQDIEKLFDEFRTQLAEWTKLHKKGDTLLRQFAGDVASLREGNVKLAEELTALGLSIDIIASESAASMLAEKRLQELRELLQSLNETTTKMHDITLAAKDRLSTEKDMTQVIDRGTYGCGISCVDYVQFMDTYMEMYRSELGVRRSIIEALDFSIPTMVLTTYSVTWQAQPFLDTQQIATIRRKLKLHECLK